MGAGYIWIDTPVGRLQLRASEAALTAVLWEHERPGRVSTVDAELRDDHPVLLETAKQLAEYFAGERTCFELPIAPAGTSFQKQVWSELCAIPYGETRSYAELARSLGDVKLSRAVGAANGRNPCCIVVPCHRVVGAGGDLVGFAGGLDAKAYLLAFERRETRLFDLLP